MAGYFMIEASCSTLSSGGSSFLIIFSGDGPGSAEVDEAAFAFLFLMHLGHSQ